MALVFVSHKLEEVFDLCDRVTVLRDGKNAAADVAVAGLDRDRLVTYMIGRAEVIAELPPKPVPGEPMLELAGLTTEGGDAVLNLVLRKGEVLGVYGLVGAGRSKLAKTLVGEVKVTGGEVPGAMGAAGAMGALVAGGAAATTVASSTGAGSGTAPLRQAPVRMSSKVIRVSSTGATPFSTPSL